MTFFKLCKYDLKNGMFKEGIKYLACVILFLGFCRLYIYKGKRLGGAHIRRFSILYNCGYGGIYTYAGKYFYVPGALDAYDFGTAIYHTLLSVL